SVVLGASAPHIIALGVDVLTDGGLTLASHTVAPSGTNPDNTVFGRLLLDPFLPAAGSTVTLTSSNPAVASVPASVVVFPPPSLDADASHASCAIGPKQVRSPQRVAIAASMQAGSGPVQLTGVRPST